MDIKQIKSIWAAWQEVQEKKAPVTKKDDDGEGMDPVGKEDGDLDNDGDKDSSDEYLANRRKKIGKAMKKEGKVPPQFAKKGEKDDDGEEESDEKSDDKSDDKSKKPEKGENPFAKKKKEVDEWVGKEGKGARRVSGGDKRKADKDDEELEEGNAQCPKCEGKGTVDGKTCTHCDGKGYHAKESYSKKMKESNLFSADELAAIEEKASGEEFMSTSSPKEKKVMADHKKGSDKKYEDYEDASQKDASNAGRSVKSQSTARRGDNLKVGDNSMPTPTKAKGQ